MKQLSTLIFLFLLSFTISAQVEINPEVIMFESEGEDFVVEPEVFNNTGNYIDIFWMFEKGENFPDEWSMTICDDTLCYTPNTFKSSTNLPNAMNADDSFKFKITVTANGVAGSSWGIIHLYDDTKCENEVAVSNPPTSSVANGKLEKLILYPNPTNDAFSIKSDVNVEAIDVMSHTGQLLFREKHTKGQNHSVAHLSNGVYYLVLKNKEGRVLSSQYLTKN